MRQPRPSSFPRRRESIRRCKECPLDSRLRGNGGFLRYFLVVLKWKWNNSISTSIVKLFRWPVIPRVVAEWHEWGQCCNQAKRKRSSRSTSPPTAASGWAMASNSLSSIPARRTASPAGASPPRYSPRNTSNCCDKATTRSSSRRMRGWRCRHGFGYIERSGWWSMGAMFTAVRAWPRGWTGSWLPSKPGAASAAARWMPAAPDRRTGAPLAQNRRAEKICATPLAFCMPHGHNLIYLVLLLYLTPALFARNQTLDSPNEPGGAGAWWLLWGESGWVRRRSAVRVAKLQDGHESRPRLFGQDFHGAKWSPAG